MVRFVGELSSIAGTKIFVKKESEHGADFALVEIDRGNLTPEIKRRLFATLKSHPDFLKNVALFAISGSGADKIVESALGTPAK